MGTLHHLRLVEPPVDYDRRPNLYAGFKRPSFGERLVIWVRLNSFGLAMTSVILATLTAAYFMFQLGRGAL